MVLARKVEEWADRAERRLAEDIEREEAEIHQTVRERLNEWFEWYGIPHVEELEALGTDAFKSLAPPQAFALRHILDVLKNGECTDRSCPYQRDSVPDYIRKPSRRFFGRGR